MNIWIDCSGSKGIGQSIHASADRITDQVRMQMLSRGTRAVNELRNAELDVLRGQRGGKTYRKYPNRSTYSASAPGEPPAVRTGNLRMHWSGSVEGGAAAGGGVSMTAVLESQEHYAGYLEHGTVKMAARPYCERIKEKAMPKILEIFSAPYV